MQLILTSDSEYIPSAQLVQPSLLDVAISDDEY
jgi:hypothetical protein